MVNEMDEQKIDSVLMAIGDECTWSAEEHGDFASMHEGWAVLYEEVDELWDEVRKKRSERDGTDVAVECIQIAAMALKFACRFSSEEDLQKAIQKTGYNR